MNHLDNVERRDSDPHAHTRMVAPDHDTTELYERHLIAVCHAIRSTPVVFLDPLFVGQVLNTLACVVSASGNPKLAEALDILVDSL